MRFTQQCAHRIRKAFAQIITQWTTGFPWEGSREVV